MHKAMNDRMCILIKGGEKPAFSGLSSKFVCTNALHT